MTDIARARDAIEALLKLKTINKDARYFAETAMSHLQDPTIVMDQRTPDSPFEAVPGQDTFDRPDYGPGPRSITITCPRCGRTSYNPEDVAKRYCGRCHRFHDDMSAKDTFKREGW